MYPECILSPEISWDILRHPEVWPRCRYLVLGLHPCRDGHELRTFQRRLRDRYVTWPETEMKTSQDEPWLRSLSTQISDHFQITEVLQCHWNAIIWIHLVQNHVVSQWQCVGFVLIWASFSSLSLSLSLSPSPSPSPSRSPSPSVSDCLGCGGLKHRSKMKRWNHGVQLSLVTGCYRVFLITFAYLCNFEALQNLSAKGHANCWDLAYHRAAGLFLWELATLEGHCTSFSIEEWWLRFEIDMGRPGQTHTHTHI